ncbi:MFS transporter [Syntrophotalea acetylenivorans]|uniref:MFS transporter n=1 Tax=Syntrophotalea acetylenivorans TaxID=1842532 RepID=A0A1L3GNQ5_9BACT|nr:MFS transporter [Syntrophotalea acetylenivorans]APG27515.1 MFS transporter [Syntrophotalea acetylenivorans]
MSRTARVSPGAVLFVVCSALFLMPFMLSAVAVALPTIGRSLQASALQVGLVETLYVLSVAVFLLPMGRFGDVYGRRRVFIWGIFLFTLATALIALSLSIEMLIAMRLLQGVGSAMVNASSLALVVSVFPSEKRGRVLGIAISTVYAGISCGPPIGGLLTSYFGWRAVFVPGVVLGLLSSWLTLVRMRSEWHEAAGEPFDWGGSLVYALAISAITLGGSRLDAGGWAVGLLLLGILFMGLFVALERRCRYPILDIDLLTGNRIFALSNVAAFINYGSTFGVVFFLSLYLQYAKGMIPRDAGLLLMLQPLVQMLLAPVGGRLADRFPAARIATLGMTLCCCGLLLAANIDLDMHLSLVVGTLLLLGLGYGFFSTPNTSVIMGCLDKRYLGVASGLTGTMRSLGMTFSMIVVTLSFSLFMDGEAISSASIPSFMRSMRSDMLFFCILSVIGIGCSLGRLSLFAWKPGRKAEL